MKPCDWRKTEKLRWQWNVMFFSLPTPHYVFRKGIPTLWPITYKEITGCFSVSQAHSSLYPFSLKGKQNVPIIWFPFSKPDLSISFHKNNHHYFSGHCKWKLLILTHTYPQTFIKFGKKLLLWFSRHIGFSSKTNSNYYNINRNPTIMNVLFISVDYG